MYFLTEDDDLLEEHTTVWDRVSTGIEIEFDRELDCNKIFLKTKIRSYTDKVTDFYSK